ncbi:hypothetical protein DPMN_070535 [Dreissena polymorpha]|uniref:Uncharacterized protein n=1 Tax=Dreissena polymorpha TaxID=45954 RepID=A0A9D3Z5H0_DREPO|nr:hypothetical protein DPMN_070535 [Dreissena polymorpha]
MTIFKLVRDIHKTLAEISTKPLKMTPPGGHIFFTDPNHFRTQLLVFTCFHNIHIEKTAPPPCGRVFPPILTIFGLVRDINETNVLTKSKIVTSRQNNAPPPGGHVFQRTRTIFELDQHIIKTNILTKLHEDWASNVTSTVFTMFFFFSSPEHNVLMVSFCDRLLSVVRRQHFAL